MRTIFLLAAAAAVVSAVPAHADPSASDNIPITAAIAPECSLQDNLGSVDLGTLPINVAPGVNALVIQGTTSGSIPDMWASCNTQATVTLQSVRGGLVSSSNDADPSRGSDGLTNQINYRAELVGFDENISLLADGTAGEESSVLMDAFHKEVELWIHVNASDNVGKRPLAGQDYRDTLILTLAAI